MAEKITDVNMLSQATTDSQAYAVYVALDRSIPSFIDGLKPVARRILWCAANDFGGQGFIKTANMVGQVMRKYNPHGDSGVNTALTGMINDFSTKYPTMEGSGSWGTKVDPYAAQPRYNACKISQFAMDVFINDIKEDKRATDWKSNYDNKYLEPVYLPAKIPILLISGQMGIGVGIKTTIPSHNLGEVIDVTIKLMKNPKAKFTLIPDECMPCEIMDTDWDKLNKTGYGTYIVQGIVDIGEYEGKPCLIVRSLPDFTFYSKIEARIKELSKCGKMPFIVDVISRSGVHPKNPKKYNFEEIIVLKKGTDPNFVKEFLYTNTNIRQTRQVNLIMIKNNNLATMGYREYLLGFIEFRRVSIFRKLNARLQTLKTKVHETELYIKLLTSGKIEQLIKLIRKSRSSDKSEIIDFFMKKFNMSPIQAKFMSKVTLPELSEGYLKQCQKRMKVYNDEIKDIMRILLDNKIDDIIIKEMLEIKAKYNDERKCHLVSPTQIKGIAPGLFKMVIMNNNYIKKMNVNDMVPPSQMGRVNLVLVADNAEDMVLFSSLGKAFKIPVHKIPLSDPGSDGTDVRILNKYCTTNIIGAARETTLKHLAETSSKDKKNKNFIFTVTNQGYIKKIDIDDVINAPTSGIIYARVDDGDYVNSVLFGPSKMDIMLYTANKVIRLNPKEVPYLRRATKGNRVSTANTTISGMNFILPKMTDLVVVTAKGHVNRIPLDHISRVSRGRAGISVIRLGKGDSIHTVWTCTPEAKLIVREGRSQKEFPVSGIKPGSTVDTGKKMFADVNKVMISYQ